MITGRLCVPLEPHSTPTVEITIFCKYSITSSCLTLLPQCNPSPPRDVKSGVHGANGWPNSAYGVSKIGVTVMTPIQQAELDADETKSDLVVNCVSVVHSRVTCN